MMGQTVLMELRANWKSVLVVCLLALVVSGGMTYLFPTFSSAFDTDIKGSENVRLVLPSEGSGEANLSWVPFAGVSGYVVLEDSSVMISNSTILYVGGNNYTTFEFNSSETRYFTVLGYYGDSLFGGSMEMIGMATNSPTSSSPFEEMMTNPAFAAFTGGREDLDFTSIRGFLSIELFSWWWILAGLFMAYYSVSVVTGDFEGKRMDLLFSTPLSRKGYIIEKFLFLTLMGLFMVVIGGLALVASLASLDLLGDLPADIAFLSMFSSLPLLMLISSTGILFAVVSQNTKTGMGLNFTLVFGSFIISAISGLAGSLDKLKYLSMMHYWDYNALLLDEVVPSGGLVILVAASMVALSAAIYIFDRMDIPA